MRDLSKTKSLSHPSAKAPDHCRRKPRKADMKIKVAFWAFHLNNKAPGGSNHGMRASKKNIVTGVVFHINLHTD